jgi:hypothetical protein
MENKNYDGHAVTEQFNSTDGTAGAKTGESKTSQSQRLADVTAAYRSALAEEDAAKERQATVQLKSINLAGSRAVDLEYDDQDSDAEELILNSGSQVAVEPSKASSPKRPVEEDLADDVDDLNSYMESFLQRMKVKSSDDPGGNAAEVSESVEAETPAATPGKAKQQPQREYSGPKSAPECKNDISAMRELANETAKVSLSDHAAWRGKRVGRYMALSATCCVVSGALAFGSQSISSYMFIAAAATYGGAMFTTWRAWTGLRELQANREKPKQVAEAVHDKVTEQSTAKATPKESEELAQAGH